MTAMLGRRAAPLLGIAVFAHLYGVRLLIRTDTFRFYADTPPATWDYAEAAITYMVPIPIVLFARSIFPTWRRFWTIGAVGLTAFAAYAITSDAILREPFSAAAANNLIAIAFFVGVLAWILRPGLAPSHDVRAMRVGVAAVSLSAVADNLRGIGRVAFPGPEPRAVRLHHPHWLPGNHRGPAGAGRRRAAGGHQSRAGDRPTNPVLAATAAHAPGRRIDDCRTVPADDRRGR